MYVTLLCSITQTPNSSVVLRKDLLERVGGISENRDLISGEDFDTWIRVSRITENFVRLPECLGYYWVGNDNISASNHRQLAVFTGVFSQYLDALPARDRARAEGILAYHLGKCSLSLGEVAMARKHLYTALLSSISIAVRVKAGYFLIKSLLPSRSVRAG
jgi:hypothetical protein